MPYESGKFKLNSHRTLNFNKIKQQTQEYFSDKFEVANEFLYTPRLICKEEYYKRALLQLHQAWLFRSDDASDFGLIVPHKKIIQ
ncbi:hypothetical protein [Elizabethkingia anophelis]|uniref:hypothetical protein n=1 Tax=Elizabethkingia anophelis TaxID=1117645 RepID=UPI00320B2E62